jgi:hypothetical protein
MVRMWRPRGAGASSRSIAFRRPCGNNAQIGETVLDGFSIERSFNLAQRIAAREWRLLLPVALAFLVLPPLASDLLLPASVRAELAAAVQTNNPAPMLNAASWLLPLSFLLFALGTLGGLVVTALAVIPRISVREAIILGVRRFPVLLGILILFFIAVVLAAFAVTFVLLLLRLDMRTVQSLLFGMLMAIAAVAIVRLSVADAIIVTRHVGPIAALRESWSMTRGTFWRMLGAVAIYMVGGAIVVLALGTAVGAVLILAGNTFGAMELMAALNALFSRTLAGLVGLGFYLLGAAFFLQLDGSSRGI